MYKIVIMAGGKGERFWPKSVMKKPKQFHKIVTDNTMIQETFLRIHPEVNKENIFVVAGPGLGALILEQLPQIQKRNLIIEPEGKNTAPAIGLAAVYLLHQSPDAVMVVLTADHVIEPKREFLKAINTAVNVAEKGYLVTFGITPTRPATEYGYIEIGHMLNVDFGLDVHKVKMFREKPSYEKANKYIEEGTFLWNSGLFAFKASEILRAIEKHMNTLYSALMNIYHSLGTENEGNVKKHEFGKIKNVSIDYGIMEKADNIACVRPKFLWDDVGSWCAIARHRAANPEGNVVEGNAIFVDSRDNIVLGDTDSLISLIGISNSIVVKEGNKILISSRAKDQKVKDVLKILAQDKKYFKFR